MSGKLLAFALTALASAAPLSSSSNAPCLSADFSLAMSLNVGSNPVYVSLNAVDSGSNGTLVLVGERLSRYAGTPVASNGPSGNATFDLTISPNDTSCEPVQPGTYGISVPDLGERYGAATPALATKNQQWPHFYYAGGEVEPERTSAAQLWFACNMTHSGVDYLTLSWGLYNSNGSAPNGCMPTRVIQAYNIPCSDG